VGIPEQTLVKGKKGDNMAKKRINIKRGKKGFTIIEVVLVLAIAGLIFLMVFIALPALQSGQRNTQREEDLGRFLTAVNDFSSNNSGRLPFYEQGVDADELDAERVENFIIRYIDNTCQADMAYTGDDELDADACEADQFRDPDGSIYRFMAGQVTDNMVTGWNADNQPDHIIRVVTNAMCGANERSVILGSGTGGYGSSTSRQVALLMMMEGGGVACNAN
jgi:prepilin-type N-terminal cleavage/methylation domain-containing protein